jgi:hypothetical protein
VAADGLAKKGLSFRVSRLQKQSPGRRQGMIVDVYSLRARFVSAFSSSTNGANVVVKGQVTQNRQGRELATTRGF